MRFLFLLLLSVVLCTNVHAQKRGEKNPPPNWMDDDYLESKYPDSDFIKIKDHRMIKRLKSHEVEEAKQTLFKHLERNLAKQISTEVIVETEQNTTSQSEITNNSTQLIENSEFREQLNVTVHAKFKYELKKTFNDKNTLWAVMVINKSECAQPLVIEAIDIIESTSKQAFVAIQNKSSRSLWTFEQNLEKASKLCASAIWLDSDVYLSNYKEQKALLAERIQIIRQLETEREFDELILDIQQLLYKALYDDALAKTRRLKYTYHNREEILNLESTIKDQFRLSIKSELQLEKTNYENNIALIENYIRHFPDDLEMVASKEGLQQEYFNHLAHQAELAIDNQQLNTAKEIFSDLSRIKITNAERYSKIKAGIDELEFLEIKKSLQSYWVSREYYNGWTNVKYLLSSSAKYLDEKDVKKWKKKFGSKCKKLDFKDARKAQPFLLTVSLSTELRTNNGLMSALFNDNTAFQLQQGYFSYNTAVYFRSVKEPDVTMKNEKQASDKSKASYYGIKFCYLDYSTVQNLGTYDGEVTPIPQDSSGYEISFDMYQSNVLHVGLGLQTDSDLFSQIDLADNNYFLTLGLRIPIYSRRGNVAIDINANLIKSPEDPANFNFSSGISWNPYFFRIIDNKSVIKKRYN